MNFKKMVKLVSVIASVLVAYYLAFSLEESMRLTFSLLILASALWVTETLPLGVTGFVIAFAQPLLGIKSFEETLTPFFSPTVVLLLCSFLLAIAFEKHDLDEVLTYLIIKRLSDNAKNLVLGLMFTTAFLSMWISNTASAALMTTLALNLTIMETRDKDKENFFKILVLSVAYSATVGGIATLIGTPPNAVAAGIMYEMLGYNMTFLGWAFRGCQ
jgi:sodium-dependent dicarboxylate transporter 2/3/5